ncbi:hypothetical protein L6164_020219 [Bauhinia variegata]|uniref:Uncharacterized protein n=1 Tax=Bauhinia variegata TaxID=167791 RepID=A0ACB9MUT5_BAUVA|nr:hypothetical protein L6164_020219 [Bauhinia variegata]
MLMILACKTQSIVFLNTTKKAMIATSFDVSASPLLPPPLCSRTLHQSRSSFLKLVNCKGRINRKLPSLSTKAGVKASLETLGVPTSVPVRVAHELLLAGHRYLDVRTPEEFNAGHAPGAINIPYMYTVGSGMSKNINFVAEVSSHFRKDDEIIVGCQLGKRSMMAATDLLAAGFTGITDIAGGYAAWTQNGLPTEQ